MNRVIVITKCAECPHEWHVCERVYCDALHSGKHDGLRELVEYPDIPDWCPLERAETKGASDES